jgi:hypothetical protein
VGGSLTCGTCLRFGPEQGAGGWARQMGACGMGMLTRTLQGHMLLYAGAHGCVSVTLFLSTHWFGCANCILLSCCCHSHGAVGATAPHVAFVSSYRLCDLCDGRPLRNLVSALLVGMVCAAGVCLPECNTTPAAVSSCCGAGSCMPQGSGLAESSCC